MLFDAQSKLYKNQQKYKKKDFAKVLHSTLPYPMFRISI